MALNIAIVTAALATAIVLWLPVVRGSTTWRAMTTPLASIIGSGFLVLGPVLSEAFGKYAPLVMCALCLVAYFFGAAIRFNIASRDANTIGTGPIDNGIETIASWTLAFAYIISVAYYLNLLGSFGVRLTQFNDPVHAKILTSAVFILILSVGWFRGFKSLEEMEYVSVSVKLAIIAGMMIGLVVYFYHGLQNGGLHVLPPAQTGWPALALGFGLIVTVQGFETSRYLGDEYDSGTRVVSMQWAQWLSSFIYVSYAVLLTYVFKPDAVSFSETVIVDMMRVVAPILPVLLIVAALAAQFSAAVADTSGSGGLFHELTGARLSPRVAYALLTMIGLLLTWSFNVFEIISHASRAFALYYTAQSVLAAHGAWRSGRRFQCLLFALLAIFGSLIVLFARPVEV